MTTSRRLAAILAADVAGYSRLMEFDEEGTLARLKALRSDVTDPAIASHGGRIFKNTGDGLLAEFPSVVEAVRCAIAVQREVHLRKLADKQNRIEFRIGLHVGDVIVDSDDIYGDGVNIAARLESFADPGGICVSSRVYEDAAGKIDAGFQDRGEQAFKNIARSIRVYGVQIADRSLPPPPTPEPSKPATRLLRNIGYLGVGPRPVQGEFRRALAAYGHIEGETIAMQYRWSEGVYARYAELVRQLLDLPVDVIVASATPAVVAAKQATTQIPIVMLEVGDPIGYGIVPSLMRPGGNITGLSNALHEYGPRGLRLMKEIIPDATRVTILAHGNNPGVHTATKAVEDVAHALDMIPKAYNAGTLEELRTVLANLDPRTDILSVTPDHGFAVNRSLIIASAQAMNVPVLCPSPEYVADGGFLSLGPNRTEIHRRVAYYVDAILKGTPPSALPIEEPTKHWLSINLRTARALGITVPAPILIRADEVIE